MGEDPTAPNYDREHKIIRSLMNGSRGPLLRKATALDWAGDPIEVAVVMDDGQVVTLRDSRDEIILVHGSILFLDYSRKANRPPDLRADSLAKSGPAQEKTADFRDFDSKRVV